MFLQLHFAAHKEKYVAVIKTKDKNVCKSSRKGSLIFV